MTGMIDDECSINPLNLKFEAFNFDCYEIDDGHNESEILNIIQKTKDSKKPIAIICNTIKGKGISFMEGNIDWHYRPPSGEDFKKAMAELGEL